VGRKLIAKNKDLRHHGIDHYRRGTYRRNDIESSQFPHHSNKCCLRNSDTCVVSDLKKGELDEIPTKRQNDAFIMIRTAPARCGASLPIMLNTVRAYKDYV
jgi:hypothetical protein